MLITKKSLYSGKTHTMEIALTPQQWEELQKPSRDRRRIQEIVPNLSSNDREFILSGTTPDEWQVLSKD